MIFAASIEAEFTTTVSDGDVKHSGINGDWDIDTRAVYVVSRLGDRFYGKVRYGFLWEDLSVDIAGNSQSDSDSSISWGAAAGWMFAEQLGVQADATRIDADIHYWNVGLVYRFWDVQLSAHFSQPQPRRTQRSQRNNMLTRVRKRY